jgi:hypothetical protein
MRSRAVCFWLIATFVLELAGCGGGGSGTTAASGPFTGTWSGSFSNSAGIYPMTLTLSQTGASVAGVAAVTTAVGTGTESINGTANGNTATVAFTNSSGTTVVPVATFSINGTGMSVNWATTSGFVITGTLTSGGIPVPQPGTAACVNPNVGTLNVTNTYYVEQKSDMYIMVFNGAGVPILQGYNQVVQDVLSGPYIVKTYGRAADGKIYTDDSWNLCSSSAVQVDACKVNQYTSNAGCKGRPLPHG